MSNNENILKELLVENISESINEHKLLEQLALEPAPPPRKIKTIAIFYHRFYAGGVERVISEQFRYFLELGYKVVLITEVTSTKADFSIPDQIVREIIPAKVEGRLEALQEIFERHNVDLYYTHASFARQTLWDLLIVRFLLKRRVIVHAHGIFPCSLVWDEDNLQYRIDLYRLADKLIVLTRADAFYYQSYGIDCVYLPNPLPIIEAPKLVSDSRFDTRTVLAVGRVCSVKRTLDVLKVAAELQKVDTSIKLLIIGSHEDAVYWRQVQNFYRAKALATTVNFMPYTTDIEKEYLKGSLLVVTSQLEGFPMVMAEAKGFSLPVISYDLPYIEFFRLERNGIISVPQGDYLAMAREIKRVLDDRSLYNNLSIDSRSSYEKMIASADLKESYADVVKSLEDNKESKILIYEDARAAFEALVHQMRERCRLVASREYLRGAETTRRSLLDADKNVKKNLAPQKKLVIVKMLSWVFEKFTKTLDALRTLGFKVTCYKIKEKIIVLLKRVNRK